MMKILILNYEYPPLGGGAGVGTKAIAENLVKIGHHVTVLTTQAFDLKEYEQLNGVEIHRVKVIGRSKLHGASWLSLFTWPIMSLIKGIQLCQKSKFDIINTHFFAPTGPTGTVLSKLFRIPNIVYAHGGDVYDPDKMNTTPSGEGALSSLLRLSMKWQAKFSAGIVTQTSDLQSKINKVLPNTKVDIIPLPFDRYTKLIPKKTFSSDGFSIVALGRVVERKGFQYLIKSLVHLPNDITLTIIGDGKYMTFLQNLVSDLNLAKRVKFTGFISSERVEDKFKILHDSDIFVMPSTYEAMGVVLLEAMSVGLPIITTNAGGQVDIVSNEINGFIVDPANEEQLAEKILQMYNERQLLSKFSKNNIQKIKNFYPEHLVLEYEKYFKKHI
jgi:L-malate glycosyltransferase